MAKSSIPRACRNCHRIHQIADHEPTDCFFVTIRRSGRMKLQHSNHIHSILIPQSVIGQRKLRDLIWAEFESIKVENDLDREHLVAEERGKGHLRVKAPIPWLSWAGADGHAGQTRSSPNFQAIWERQIERANHHRPIWLTSVLLTTDQFENAGAEDSDWLRSRSDSWHSGSHGSLSNTSCSSHGSVSVTSSSSHAKVYVPFAVR